MNSKKKVTAIGALAVPVLRHHFGKIKWRLEDIQGIYRKTVKIISVYKIRYPKADEDELQVGRKKVGRSCFIWREVKSRG
jgi:hypothetical protein